VLDSDAVLGDIGEVAGTGPDAEGVEEAVLRTPSGLPGR
jgi:hypothetical protein